MRVVIPAAGLATRFGGVRKELLPLSEAPGDTPLARAVAKGLALGAVTVVTSLANVHAHARALADQPVSLVVRSDGTDDLWCSIQAGMGDGDGGLILPDTVWEGHIPRTLDAAVVFGVFPTMESERYSVIRAGRIVTKQPDTRRQSAWGCVFWRREAAALWHRESFATYDAAFQAAMTLGYSTFAISAYHDFASFAAYREWIRQCTSAT